MQSQIHPMMAPAPRPEEEKYPHHRRQGSLGLNEKVPVSLEDLGVPSPSPFQSSLNPPPRKYVSRPFPIMEQHAAQTFLHRIGSSMDSASVSSQSSVMSSSWVCSKCSYSNVDVYNEQCAVCGISDPQEHQPAPKKATSWLSIGSRFSSEGAPVEVLSDDGEKSELNLLSEQTTAVEAAKSPSAPKRPSPEDSFSEISSPPQQRPTLPTPLSRLQSSIMNQKVVLFPPGSQNCHDDDDVHSVTNHSVATVKVSNKNSMPQRRPQSQFAVPTAFKNINRTSSMSDCMPPAPLEDPKTHPISNNTNTTSSLVRHPTMPNLGAPTHSNMRTTSTHIISSSAHTLAPSSRLVESSSSSSTTTTRRNSAHQFPSRKIHVPPLPQNVALDVHAKPKARSSGVREDWEHPTSSSISNAFVTAEDCEHPARRQMRSSSVASRTPNSSRRFDAPSQKESSHHTLATTCSSSHADEPNQANEVELMELGRHSTTTARSQQSSRSSASSLHTSDPAVHVTMDTDKNDNKRRIRKWWLLLFLFAILVGLLVGLIVGLSVGVMLTSKNNMNADATSGSEATRDFDMAPTMTP